MNGGLEELKKGSIHPIYHIVGQDRYQRKKYIEMLENAVYGEKDSAEYFESNDIDLAFGSARLKPLLLEKRLIFIEFKNKIDQKVQKRILNYIANPSKFAVVVFLFDVLDSKKDFLDKLESASHRIENIVPKGKDLEKWIEDRFKSKKVKPSRVIIQLLLDRFGGDLESLDSEIEVLSLSLDEKNMPDSDDVDLFIGNDSEVVIYKLTDYLDRGKIDEALVILSRILKSSKEPLFLIGMLLKHYRTVWSYISLTRYGLSRGEVENALNLKGFIAKKYSELSNRFSRMELKKRMKLLQQLDLALKKTSGDTQILFEKTICNFLM